MIAAQEISTERILVMGDQAINITLLGGLLSGFKTSLDRKK